MITLPSYSHPSPNVGRLVTRLQEHGISGAASSVGIPADGYTVTVTVPDETTLEQISWIDALLPNHHIETLVDAQSRTKLAIAEEKARRYALGFPHDGTSFLTGQPVTLRFSLSEAAKNNYQRVEASPSIVGPFPTVWLNEPDTDGIVITSEADALALVASAYSYGTHVVKRAGFYTAQVLAAPDVASCDTLLATYLAES